MPSFGRFGGFGMGGPGITHQKLGSVSPDELLMLRRGMGEDSAGMNDMDLLNASLKRGTQARAAYDPMSAGGPSRDEDEEQKKRATAGQQAAAMASTAGAPVTKEGQFNVMDMGRGNEAWYDLPSATRTQMMVQAKEARDQGGQQ